MNEIENRKTIEEIKKNFFSENINTIEKLKQDWQKMSANTNYQYQKLNSSHYYKQQCHTKEIKKCYKKKSYT